MVLSALDDRDATNPAEHHGACVPRLRGPHRPRRMGRGLPRPLRNRIAAHRARVLDHVPPSALHDDVRGRLLDDRCRIRELSPDPPGRRSGEVIHRRGPRPRGAPSVGSGGSAATRASRFAVGPMRRYISAASSFARSRYSCSFIAAGFAEIRRYESFSVIFSFTFCRNRMIDANPFCEIMYSRPSRTTAAFPPSEAKSEMAVAMSTSALGSATAIPFAVAPADLESQIRGRLPAGGERADLPPRGLETFLIAFQKGLALLVVAHPCAA